MDGDMGSLIHQWICNQDLQATAVLGLMCVGTWMVLTWLLQILFTIVWPFFLVVVVMILVPSLRQYVAEDLFPKYIELITRLYWQAITTYETASNADTNSSPLQ